MDQVHVVRHKVLVEGRSARWVAREMGVSRNTVKRYLSQAAPTRVERQARGRPVREKAGARLEALLVESPQWTGGKQRLTASRLHRMLLAEGLTIGITTVRRAVAEWKRRRREVFVPLVYPARAHRHGGPSRQELLRPQAGGVVPEALELFLEQAGTHRAEIDPQQLA
jgi:transposase